MCVMQRSGTVMEGRDDGAGGMMGGGEAMERGGEWCEGGRGVMGRRG